MNKKILIFSIIGVIALFLGVLLFFFLYQNAPSSHGTGSFTFFGSGNNNNPFQAILPGNNSLQNENNTGGGEKIFNISPGPVAGAVFITTNATNTIARFVMQDTGHVFDVPITISGIAPQTLSDITIPGSQEVIWTKQGNAVLLQYLDNANTIKTVYIQFSNSTSTAPSTPKEVQFLPDNILSMATSPDGNSIVYLLKNQSGGINGYIALADGTQPKKIFYMPLTQMIVSWPNNNILLLQTKSATDVPGIVFEVGIKNGNTVPLLYGQGLTAIANNTFNTVVYQTRFDGTVQSYVHNLTTGADSTLTLNPSPERCVFNPITSTELYCANPNTLTDASYLDLWHQGQINNPDRILFYNLTSGTAGTIAQPGSSDGGAQASIAQLIISPDDRYLMYITRGDRSLWGVRLTQ